jgi:hypothetical protein
MLNTKEPKELYVDPILGRDKGDPDQLLVTLIPHAWLGLTCFAMISRR